MTSLLTGKLWAGGFHDPDEASQVTVSDEVKCQGRRCTLIGLMGVTETCCPLAFRQIIFFPAG